MSPHNFLLVFTACMVGGFFISQGESVYAEKPQKGSINDFSMNYFREIAKTEEGNFTTSPFGVAALMGNLYLGAQEDTAKEIQDVLKWSGDKNGWIALAHATELAVRGADSVSFASGIWIQNGYKIQDAYLKMVQDIGPTEVKNVNFSAGKTVALLNQWCEENTQKRIKNMFSGFPQDTRTVLANALYFKAKWKKEFKKAATRDAKFTKLDGSQVPCKLMFQDDAFRYLKDEQCQYLEMPYVDSNIMMCILLPCSPDSFLSTEKEFGPDTFRKYAKKARIEKVRVFIPKFTMETQLTLETVLQNMGIRKAFSPSAANFSAMTESNDLYLSSVLQKVFIRVDEEGTEAAAVTTAMMRTTSVRPVLPTVFRADRPFFFMIKEVSTDTPLFMGRVMDTDGLWKE